MFTINATNDVHGNHDTLPLFSGPLEVFSFEATSPSGETGPPPLSQDAWIEVAYSRNDQSQRYENAAGALPIKLETRGTTSPAPQQAGAKAARAELFARRAGPSLSQSEFWKNTLTLKASLAAKLREAGEIGLAATLDDCHSFATNQVCTHCGTVKRFWNRCDRLWCPACQPRLTRERQDSIKWWTNEVKQPKHVVLTVRNTSNLSSAKLTWLKNCFARLRRRNFARSWRGGFWSLELTNEDRGWHLHLHCLIDADWIDARLLAIEWGSVTHGEGYIVKVKDCRETSYLQEVTKYAVKGVQLVTWKPQDIILFINAFEGQRTFGVFGSLYGKRSEFKCYLKTELAYVPSCACGCDSFKYLNDDECEVFLSEHFGPAFSAARRQAPTTADGESTLPGLKLDPPQVRHVSHWERGG
jgi:hypothetical protein